MGLVEPGVQSGCALAVLGATASEDMPNSPRESASAAASLILTGRLPCSIFQMVAWLKPNPRSVMRWARASWLSWASSRRSRTLVAKFWSISHF